MSNVGIYYQNCRGTRTKLAILYTNILSNCYDVIVLTETWLVPEIADGEFIDQRYVVFRCDRDRVATGKKDGGGVLIAVLRNLRPSGLFFPSGYSSNKIEHIMVELCSGEQDKRNIISAAYIPPGTSSDIYLNHFTSLQNTIDDSNTDNYYVFGDYNITDADWAPDGIGHAMNFTSTSVICSYLNCFMSVTNAKQCNHFYNSHNKILDLILTNSNCTVQCPSIDLVKRDPIHPPFLTYTTFSTECLLRRRQVAKYNYYKANYLFINEELENANWASLLDGTTAEQSLDTFYETVFDIIKRHAPLSSAKVSSFPSWFPGSLIHIFKNKNKAWCKWKKFKNKSDYESFSLYRSRFKAECKKAFTNYKNSVEESIPTNVKFFWAFVNNRKQSSKIPSSIQYKNTTSNDPEQICNLFATFFRSVYEPSTCTENALFSMGEYSENCSIIDNIYFSEQEVKIALKMLDASKGPGPDHLPPIFLKRTSDSIFRPLYMLFNRFIAEGTFPDIWKRANIVPVHKGGSRNNVQNYRPISILCTLSKLFEGLVHGVLYPVVNKILIPEQHGFVKRKSTVTNLMIFTGHLFENMDKRIQTDAVYTDFQKAFDRVDHAILLSKLAFNGIRGNLLRWFSSYINNRSQRVVINGYHSASITATSGVPQGSILGPLLFILYINDIKKCFGNSNFLLYADDLKVFMPVRTINDCVLLQDDLDRLTEYCQINKLKLSIPKCNFITFTKNKRIIYFPYRLCNEQLLKISTQKDLGVFLDSELHLDMHIEKIINKAFRMYGFVIRATSEFNKISTFMYLYNSLIRPQLEYACAIWDPYYEKYNVKIENVQKKFLKCMNYRCKGNSLSYKELLNKYKLLTLKDRRILLQTMLLHGLCHNKYDCPQLVNRLCYIVPRTVHRRAVRVHRLFDTRICRTNAGVRSPLRRIVCTYNEKFIDIDLFGLSEFEFRRGLGNALLNG